MRLYLRFLAIHVKSAMTYKTSFFLSCLGHLFIALNCFLGVTFLLNRFGDIGGYTLPQLALCYAVILAATSLAECFARGFDAFPRILRQAQFDRILVRPRSLVAQVICQDLKLTVASRLLQAVAMAAWAIRAGAVAWTVGKAAVFALMILCGAGVFFGLFLIYAALCFFTLEGLEVMNIFTDGAREYGKNPFGVYGRGVLWLLTALVPLALIQHWPLQYLLDRGPWQYGLLPPVSLLFLLPCLALWRLGVRHYASTGS